ncbi:MAG: hypothetical protein ACLGI6_04760 [Gammaproteobacteria bacterium]
MMEELNEPTQPAADTAAAPAAPAQPSPSVLPARQRRWPRFVLYGLAALGLLFVVIVGFSIWKNKHPAHELAKRIEIDPAAVIEQVMTRTYGKYSESRHGYLYVDENDRTFVVTVIQQAHLQDKASGDELYFVASGKPVSSPEQTGDSGGEVHGLFLIRPNADTPGELEEVSVSASSPRVPLRPEDVRLERLSDELWAWILTLRDQEVQTLEPLLTIHQIAAARGKEIAMLAEFPASSVFTDDDCAAFAKRAAATMAAWEARQARESQQAAKGGAAEAATSAGDADAKAGKEGGEGVSGAENTTENKAENTAENKGASEDEEYNPDGWELPMSCENRVWSYRIAKPNGKLPAPITVTLGGTVDQKPVKAATWKLVFDTKAFQYNVPDELSPYPPD